MAQVQTSLWDVAQQWADELLNIEAEARELVVRRYTCGSALPAKHKAGVTCSRLCILHQRCLTLLPGRRNVKAESLEFEQVQELLEVRPDEDASYKEDWAANRQRALALVAHIADSASEPPRPIALDETNDATANRDRLEQTQENIAARSFGLCEVPCSCQAVVRRGLLAWSRLMYRWKCALCAASGFCGLCTGLIRLRPPQVLLCAVQAQS